MNTVFLQGLTKPGTTTFTSLEVFSTYQLALQECEFLYNHAELPEGAPQQIEWIITEGDPDMDIVRTYRSKYFESDSDLVIQEKIVDHDVQ